MTAPNGFDAEFASPAEWARFYRSLEIQVVPAFMPGESRGGAWKRPLLKDWRQYQDNLVPDAVFNPWYGPLGQYRQRPNMGVICGRASHNLMVIDLDIHKNDMARRWWLGLLAVHNNDMDLETVEQRTGGGGLQKLFLCPQGWTPPTCKTSIGVDIRGQGGFAMLCPSMHESGKAYEWLDGRSPDDLDITMAPAWLLEAVTALVVAHGGQSGQERPDVARAGHGAYDGFGHQTDGREQKMTELIWGAVVDWRREWARPGMPDDAQSRAKCAEKYLVYEGLVSARNVHPNGTNKTDALEAEGRGTSLFWRKWQYAMRQWETDVAEEAAKPQPGKSGNYRADEPAGGADFVDFTDEYAKAKTTPPPPAGLYEMLSVKDIKALADPQWLVDGMVVEQAMGFVYGPPGCLKTFIALGMALSITTGQKAWWGRGVQRKGAVIYICSEGTKSLKFRIAAWERHFKVSADDAPFVLIRQNINFMREDDVIKLLHTVQAAVDQIGPIAAVFVDTVSRVLPGAEENLQKDMTLFVAACDAVRQTFGATVIGLHHTNANGGFRGSTVMPGAGDFLLEVRREPGAMVGSVYAKKIKDDEDGWEQAFKVTSVELPGIIFRTSLVVDSDAVPEQREGANKDRAPFEVREQILSELDKAWCNLRPWSHAPNSPRSGVLIIMKRWGLNRKTALDILNTWLARDIIEEVVFDVRNKYRGYRKMKDL